MYVCMYLRQVLTNVNDKDQPNDRQGAMYRIKCTNFQSTYIGEIGTNLKTRLTEHKRATKSGDIRNHIPEHHRLRLNTKSTGTLLSASLTTQTTNND